MKRGITILLASILLAIASYARDKECPLHIAWRQIGRLDTSAGGPGFGVLDDRIIFVGGTHWTDDSEKVWLDQVQIFNLRSAAWEDKIQSPAKSGYPCALVLKKNFYIFGGQSAKDANQCDVWKLTRSNISWEWESFAALPEKLANMQSALIGSTAFMVAGDSGEKVPEPDNKVWKIELDGPVPQWRTCASLPGTMRTGVATTACGGKLYSFGGGVKEAYMYDPARDQWSRIEDLPYSSQWSWAVSYQDRYIVIPGGFVAKEKANSVPPYVHRDINGFIADVLVYDVTTARYSFSDALPKGIIDYGLAIKDNCVYIAGGEDLQKHRESWLLMGSITLDKHE